MEEQFVNKFMVNLQGKVLDRELEIIRNELFVFISNYDISSKETEVGEYIGYIPECYKTFFVTRKIEGMSEKTLYVYNLYLMDFFAQVNKSLEKITTNDIRVYLYTLQKRRNISDRTLESRRTIINSFFEWCVNEEYLCKNPGRGIKKIKYERKEREPLSGLELEKVRGACQNIRERALVEVLYSTGCRVTELERLNKSDVNFDTKEVKLFGKGNKHRVSYLNARAEIVLKEYLSTRTDTNEALFVYQRKPYLRLKKSGIEKIIKGIGEASGIERRVFPHLIRHTTATDAIQHGMDVTELQQILGHERLDTTMVYAKISGENVRHNHKKYII